MSPEPTAPIDAPPGSGPYIVWMAQTLGIVAVAAALFVGFNIHEDMLGLHGRSPVAIYALERYSKYLMSYRYVPEHYDGILISNSVAANWDTGAFTTSAVFNAGLRGSTITEEKLIVDRVVERGHLKVAVIVLLPSLTGAHGRRTAYMTPHDYQASFGSVQSLILDAQAALERYASVLRLPASVAAHKFARDGAMSFPMAREASDVIPALNAAELQGDPEAIAEFTAMLQNLHEHGVRVYGVFAPLYAGRWQTAEAPALRTWAEATRALFAPGDTLIDLNDGQLAGVTADRQSFPDYLHLSPEAAAKAMAAVVAHIER